MDEVDDEVIYEKEAKNIRTEDSLSTNCFIEKYYGDVTDISTRQLIENEVIIVRPDADPNEKMQFKIWCDHPDEYVHLEECEFSQEDVNGNIIYQEVFMRDGCVEDAWAPFIDNSASRISPTINEDWFNMRPFVTGCKTKWNIKCITASCKRGLEALNKDAFDKHCSISSTCKNRNYFDSFLNPPSNNGRRRRNVAEDVAEDTVEVKVFHPCFNVDTTKPEFCVNQNTCWTLDQCAAQYPDDYPNYVSSPAPKKETRESISNDDATLDDIIETIKDLLVDHIEEITKGGEDDEETVFLKKVTDQAKLVLAATHTIEDIVDQLIDQVDTMKKKKD